MFLSNKAFRLTIFTKTSENQTHINFYFYQNTFIQKNLKIFCINDKKSIYLQTQN